MIVKLLENATKFGKSIEGRNQFTRMIEDIKSYNKENTKT